MSSEENAFKALADQAAVIRDQNHTIESLNTTLRVSGHEIERLKMCIEDKNARIKELEADQKKKGGDSQ